MKTIVTATGLALLLCLNTSLFAQSEPRYEIQLKSRTFVPDAGFEQFGRDVESFKKNPGKLLNGKYHAVIQFFENPKQPELALLNRSHIKLHDYLPQRALVASLPVDVDLDLLTAAKIRSVFFLQPEDKISQLFTDKQQSKSTQHMTDVIVCLYPDVSTEFAQNALEHFDAEIVFASEYFHRVTVRVDEVLIVEIAALEWVSWIEPVSPTALCNDQSRISIKADVIQAQPWSLTGNGVKLGIWDGGAVYQHAAFSGRLTVVEQQIPVSLHATHACGTMAGDGAGSTNPNLRGMAPSALIYSWDKDSGDTPTEVLNGITNQGIVVSQNSWTSDMNQFPDDVFGIYAAQSRDYDKLVRDNNINVVSSAGNDRNELRYTRWGRPGWRSIPYGSGQCAKNTIVVGAIQHNDDTTAYSDYGPTIDGRVKPDLVALGGGNPSSVGVNSTIDAYTSYGFSAGTSVASPAISGTVALLIEKYRLKNAGATPKPALLKSILLNGASNLGNPGPDYKFGYGKADAEASVQMIQAGWHLEGTIIDNQTNLAPYCCCSTRCARVTRDASLF